MNWTMSDVPQLIAEGRRAATAALDVSDAEGNWLQPMGEGRAARPIALTGPAPRRT